MPNLKPFRLTKNNEKIDLFINLNPEKNRKDNEDDDSMNE